MAYIATVKILVDQTNESAVYDGLNELLREIEMEGPNGEAPSVIDWKYVSVAPIAPEIEDSIMNETYEEGDAFRLTAPTIDQPFNLVIEAYAVSEFGDGPAHAEVTVDPTFIDRLVRLCRLCKENDLESVTVAAAADRWDNQEELRIRGDSLRVFGGAFWFEAHPKHADYGVETRSIEIDTLLTIVAAGSNAPPADQCFRWSNGRLYYAGDPGLLTDLIDLVESAGAK